VASPTTPPPSCSDCWTCWFADSPPTGELISGIRRVRATEPQYSAGVLKDWLRRRRREQAWADARRQELYDEYVAKLDSGDPNALESARDFGDHDGTPWGVEVGLAGGLIVLLVAVPLLIVFFMGIKHLTGG
jgi:hypothetical protein